VQLSVSARGKRKSGARLVLLAPLFLRKSFEKDYLMSRCCKALATASDFE
jgi:hypothetical protein